MYTYVLKLNRCIWYFVDFLPDVNKSPTVEGKKQTWRSTLLCFPKRRRVFAPLTTRIRRTDIPITLTLATNAWYQKNNDHIIHIYNIIIHYHSSTEKKKVDCTPLYTLVRHDKRPPNPAVCIVQRGDTEYTAIETLKRDVWKYICSNEIELGTENTWCNTKSHSSQTIIIYYHSFIHKKTTYSSCSERCIRPHSHHEYETPSCCSQNTIKKIVH